MTSTNFTARVVPSISAIDASAWDACANPPGRSADEAEGERFNPFIAHAFLHALEASGSVGGRSGWTPAHVTVEDGRGRLVAAAPAYLKTHSQGEYVFDHAWADAYERAGGRYYPKLQVAAPFTPVTGRRLLVAADAPHGAREALIGALRELRKQTKASSIHVTFPTAEDAERLANAPDFSSATASSSIFLCQGFSSFDDFLAALASRKRKAIKRERRDALDGGVTIELLTGESIQPEHWDLFFKFYMHTGSRKWGRPYLTRAFFDLIGATLADRVLLVMARRAGRYIAGAINFIGDDALYGRNWGAIERSAVSAFRGLLLSGDRLRALPRIAADRGRRPRRTQTRARLPAGPRPIRRTSSPTRGLARAIADYLGHERAAVERTIAHYEGHAPFRRGEGDAGGDERLGESFEADV